MAVKKTWMCRVCGYEHVGDLAPDKCPQCGQSGINFTLIKEEEVKEDKASNKYKCLLCGAEFEVEEGKEPVCPACGSTGEMLEKI